MNNKEFEYNYYFEKYKEEPMLCHMRFKRNFKREHPTSNVNLNKLVIEIERYQIKKYGTIKRSSYFIEKMLYCDFERRKQYLSKQEYERFGAKKERKEREMNKKKVSNNVKD